MLILVPPHFLRLHRQNSAQDTGLPNSKRAMFDPHRRALPGRPSDHRFHLQRRGGEEDHARLQNEFARFVGAQISITVRVDERGELLPVLLLELAIGDYLIRDEHRRESAAENQIGAHKIRESEQQSESAVRLRSGDQEPVHPEHRRSVEFEVRLPRPDVRHA